MPEKYIEVAPGKASEKSAIRIPMPRCHHPHRDVAVRVHETPGRTSVAPTVESDTLSWLLAHSLGGFS